VRIRGAPINPKRGAPRGKAKKQPIPRPEPWDFFISYASEDRAIAERLLKSLSGFRAYLDFRRLRPGEAWKPALDEALASSLIIVVLYSERSSRSRFQKQEINLAFSLMESGNQQVVPILVTPLTVQSKGLPSKLRDRQCLVYTGAKDVARLASRLRERLAQLKAGLPRPRPKRPAKRSGPSIRTKNIVTVELTITGDRPDRETMQRLLDVIADLTGGGTLQNIGTETKEK
jgi:hypothetical protein